MIRALMRAAAEEPAWLVPGIAAVVAMAGNWVVKRMSRSGEAASASKTKAETVAAEVAVIREVLAEVRAQQDRDREHADRDRVRYEADLREFQARLDAIVAGLEVHQDWDRRAATALRVIDPDFPGPPPLGVD